MGSGTWIKHQQYVQSKLLIEAPIVVLHSRGSALWTWSLVLLSNQLRKQYFFSQKLIWQHSIPFVWDNMFLQPPKASVSYKSIERLEQNPNWFYPVFAFIYCTLNTPHIPSKRLPRWPLRLPSKKTFLLKVFIELDLQIRPITLPHGILPHLLVVHIFTDNIKCFPSSTNFYTRKVSLTSWHQQCCSFNVYLQRSLQLNN